MRKKFSFSGLEVLKVVPKLLELQKLEGMSREEKEK